MAIESSRVPATRDAGALWIAALWKFVGALFTLPPLAHRLDFVYYYDSALALRQGLDPYTA